VLQMLGLPEDSTGAVIAGSSQATSGDHDDLWLRHRARSGSAGGPQTVAVDRREAAAAASADLTDEQREELDLMDDDVRQLIESVIGPHSPTLVAGYEDPSGLMVEAGFPDPKVGVLLPGEDAPDGWDARPVRKWTTEQLRNALGEAN